MFSCWFEHVVRLCSKDIGLGCRYATSWSDLDLTFELAIVTLSLKILSGLNLRNCKVQEVDTWKGYWLGGVGMQHNGMTLI